MRKSLLGILACPICKGNIILRRTSKHSGEEVIQGELHCQKCDRYYYIKEGIPHLIIPNEKPN